MTTTIYKEEIFNRLFTYLTNYDKQDPVTYDGLINLPTTHVLMQHFKNNPYIATMAILYYTGKFNKNELTELDKKYKSQLNKQHLLNLFKKLFSWKDFWDEIKTFYNDSDSKQTLIDTCEKVLQTSFQEELPNGKSPVDVPTYVKHIYLQNAPDFVLEGVNNYISTTGNQISHSNAYEILKHSIDFGKKINNEYKLRYLKMKPIDFFNQCINNPDLITNLYTIKDDEFRQNIQSKYNQGQLEYLLKQKTDSISFKEHTQADLNYMNRMQCGIDENPINKIYNNGLPYYTFVKTESDTECPVIEDVNQVNTKSIINETFKNNEDLNQIKLDSITSEPNLTKILGVAGGIALLGGGAYAGYKWWQYKKQQELEKQLQEQAKNQLNDQILYSKSKTRRRNTVINNIVNTNPKPTMEYNI